MKTRIISDSSCDMKNGERENLYIVPLSISTDNHKWTDDDNIDVNSMISILEKYKGRSYTACPDVSSWLSAFGDAENIYVVTMTSGLSGTYNSAMTAAKIYKESHSDAKIMVLDTLSTCSQQRLIIDHIYELLKKGADFEEICESAKDYTKKTKLVYVLKSLHNFAQNGRINKALAAAIGFLGISIVAAVSNEGTIKPVSKCRGNKKIISEILSQMKHMNYHGKKVYISHMDNISLAEELKDSILKLYPSADVSIRPVKALCAYYIERGGLLVGFETN